MDEKVIQQSRRPGLDPGQGCSSTLRPQKRPSPGSSPGRRGDLEQQVTDALSRVYDPCSVAAGRPTSLVDMNMVLDWRLEGATLHVTFCVTFAGCTMAPHFLQAAREALLEIDGIEYVETRVDTAHIWQPLAPVALAGEPQAWRRRHVNEHTSGASAN